MTKSKPVIKQKKKIPSRVFSVGSGYTMSSVVEQSKIIRLSLISGDILEIEKRISKSMTDTKPKNVDPTPWVEKSLLSEVAKIVTHQEETMTAEERKNLIIHSGIKRKIYNVFTKDGQDWPLFTESACMYCCHKFSTTPVGIPTDYVNDRFICYGNFCSYNCAKKYLCPNKNDEDDMAAIQSYGDIYTGDLLGQKLQLLELLFHIETGAPFDEAIKPSPARLSLKLWGGPMTIDEYRESFYTNKTFHVFKNPVVAIGYQVEECIDTKNNRAIKNTPCFSKNLERKVKSIKRVK